jgi:hypothetical protein
LYVLDSLDAIKVSYDPVLDAGYDAAQRAKLFNSMITKMAGPTKRSNLHILIVSQIRENLGAMIGDKHRRAGGKAFDFFASQCIWLSMLGKIEKTIKGYKLPIGIWVKANIKKNKVGNPFRTCEFPVIFNYGIDAAWANLEWLKDVKGGLDDLDIKGTDITALAEEIRNTKNVELQDKIAKHTKEVWDAIDADFMPRSSKY